MAALTGDRDTKSREGSDRVFPVAAAARIHLGALIVLNAGNAEPGSTALNLVAVGVAKEPVDNSAGAAGDKDVPVRRGVFLFNNSAAGDAITAADIGSDCFIADDQTVAKTDGTGTRSAAGKVFDVDAQGVWVAVG
jgi:hypothetical protein